MGSTVLVYKKYNIIDKKRTYEKSRHIGELD